MKSRATFHRILAAVFHLLSFFFLLVAIEHRAAADPLSAISGGVGIFGNLLGGLLGSSSSKRAAQIQQQNAQQVANMAESAASGAQAGMGAAVGTANTRLDQTGQNNTNLYNPYIQLGNQGASTLQQLMAPGGGLTTQFSFNPYDAQQVASSPEYQFALQQGTDAVQQSQAAKGLLNSGSTLKNLMSFGQGLATQQYQNAYNNALNTFQTNRNNTLQSVGLLTNIGQGATNALAGQNLSLAQLFGNNTLSAAQYGGNAGLQGAQIAGSALTGGANAGAAGVMGGANAWSNALSGMGNTISQLGTYGYGGGGYGGGSGSFYAPTTASYMSNFGPPMGAFPTAPVGVVGGSAPNLSGYSTAGIGGF